MAPLDVAGAAFLLTAAVAFTVTVTRRVRAHGRFPWGWLAILAAALSLGAAVWSWPEHPRTVPPPPDVAPASSWTPPRHWAGMLPLVGPFFGEHREDLVGVGGDSRRLVILAIDGETLRERWSSAAGADEAGRTTQLTVVGQRVVWARGTRAIHVLDLATGSPLRTLRVAEHATALCPDPGDPTRALVVGEGGAHTSLDLETGAVSAAPGTARCLDLAEPVARPLRARDTVPAAPAGHELGAIRWAAPGDAVALAEGHLGVAFVVPRPGFPIDALLGFGVAEGDVRWSTPFDHPRVSAIDVDRGPVVVLLDRNTATHLAALDASTGALQWETPVGGPAEVFRLGPTRAYVMVESALLIFDRRMGRLVHTAGVTPRPAEDHSAE